MKHSPMNATISALDAAISALDASILALGAAMPVHGDEFLAISEM